MLETEASAPNHLLSQIGSGLGVPLLLLAERAGWYTFRAAMFVFLIDGGRSGSEVSMIATALVWLTVGAPVLGGVVAIATGPTVPLAVGGCVCAAGYVWFGLAPGLGVWPALVTIAIGQGLMKPCSWAVAAAAFPRPSEHLRSAVFVAGYAAVNVGALVGSVSASDALPRVAMFAVAAGVTSLVPVLAVGLYFASRTVPPRVVDNRQAMTTAGLSLLVIVLVAPFFAAMGTSGEAQFAGMQAAGLTSGESAAAMAMNPAVVLVCSLVLIPLLLGLHFVRARRVSALVPVGLAMIAATLGLLALHPVALGALGVPALGVGILALALTEVVVSPLALAVVADGHPRGIALLVAVWMIVTYSTSYAASQIGQVFGLLWTLPAAAVVCGLAGFAVLAAGVLARDRWMPASHPVDREAVAQRAAPKK